MSPFEHLTRKEIRAFYSWLLALPSQETAFMRNTYDSDAVREQKLKDLYIKYEGILSDINSTIGS